MAKKRKKLKFKKQENDNQEDNNNDIHSDWLELKENQKYMLTYTGNNDHLQVGNWVLKKNQPVEVTNKYSFPLSYQKTVELSISVKIANK